METDVKGTDVIIIVVYVPHFGRQNPSAEDTWGDLELLHQEFEKDPRQRRAVKILMGDFNGRLARAYNFTGTKRPAKIVEGMAEKTAEVTGCWSVHNQDNEMGTMLRQYLQDHSMVSVGSFFRPVQKKAGAATYVPFGDYKHRKSAGLDHICLSRQWFSSAINFKVRWHPSEHRWANGRGMKKDHALIEMSFRMRVAKTQPRKKPNYAALQTTTGLVSPI